ncbi:MAG: DegV family protein [Clostridiales bacterium]|nr:DegV family protein [Clostridiales bacterium]
MNNFLLCTDSGSDLMLDTCKKYDIIPLKMKYDIGGEVFTDGMTVEAVQELYKKMVDGAVPRTSQINTSEFIDFWTPLLAEKQPILHLALGSGISGTYANAVIAREMILEEHPDAEIYLVDTLGASASYGMLCVEIAKMREEGKTVQECYDWVMKARHNVDVFYTTGDLKYLHRGGRVSKTSAVVGTVLNINPILTLDPAGKLIPCDKARGEKGTIRKVCERVGALVEDASDKTLYVSHSDCPERAKRFAETLQAEFGFKDIFYTYIGAIIGSHTGPGLVAVFYLGKPRPEVK